MTEWNQAKTRHEKLVISQTRWQPDITQEANRIENTATPLISPCGKRRQKSTVNLCRVGEIQSLLICNNNFDESFAWKHWRTCCTALCLMLARGFLDAKKGHIITSHAPLKQVQPLGKTAVEAITNIKQNLTLLQCWYCRSKAISSLIHTTTST